MKILMFVYLVNYEDDCNLRVLKHEDKVDHIFSVDN